MIWKPHATVATIVTLGGKFLLVEELIDGKRVYNQPAGHVDEGERIVDAALRETLEETGWEVALDAFLGVYTYLAPGTDRTYYRFCFSATPTRQVHQKYDKEIIAPHWLAYEEILALQPRLRSPLVLKCIEDFRSGRRFPLEILWEAPR
ncbi:Nudix hydrolase [gamma proteobacterium HdN1]|nr:Nudix hydrolase [gamma proteobacterium HdN1]